MLVVDVAESVPVARGSVLTDSDSALVFGKEFRVIDVATLVDLPPSRVHAERVP